MADKDTVAYTDTVADTDTTVVTLASTSRVNTSSSFPARVADNVSSMTPATTIQYEISRDRWLGNTLQCDLRTHVYD